MTLCSVYLHLAIHLAFVSLGEEGDFTWPGGGMVYDLKLFRPKA